MLNLKIEKVLSTTARHIKKLNSWGIFTVKDLLEFFPRALEATEIKSEASQIILKEKNTLSGRLQGFRKERSRNGKYLGKGQFILDDGTLIEVIWFQIPYQLKNIQCPKRMFLVGKTERNYGKIQIKNPEIHFEQNVHIGGIRPIYPESPPITSKWLREKVHPLLRFTREFEDILPQSVRKAHNLIGIEQAIKNIHFPSTSDEWIQAKGRLGFEEIFEIQTRVLQTKILREKTQLNPYKIIFDPEIIKEDLKKLPFELTTDQKKALLEVLQDFEKDRPMHRLLQGDVGSGKTIVGLLAVLQMVRNGFQVAILAPTEILAKQHLSSLIKFGIFTVGDYDLLTGSTTAKNKTRIKEQLKSGSLKIIVGTHAILTEDTIFKNLGLAVIDEQHRFGVEQRSVLSGQNTHTLSMTATPIPRSLALTIYGDQDLSIIKEKPAGRKPIITRIVADSKTESLCYRFIDDQIQKGRQIFWVCPLVDESDKIEAKNVHDEFVRINEQIFPKHRVQFLHGKMKSKEKDVIMAAFKDHEFDILVSTSVIEVGVDIPNSTVMCIENSERFGLAQLHQFRGRIGRNDMQSYCFLMVGSSDDKNKARLQAMERSNDGFYLSEIDLKLRGAGEVYGLRQSGLPDLKCADLNDIETMKKARESAEEVVREDLTLQKHPALQKRINQGTVYF